MPDERTLRHGKRCFIRLPCGYDINTFIYELIFRQNGKKPFHPVKAFFGLTAVMEKSRCREYRNYF